VLELWGYELSEQDSGITGEAEEVLARAWCKRKLAGDDRIHLIEGKLARFYRKKGNTKAARMWMNRTLQALDSGQKIPVPEWVLRAEDARIASDEGRPEAALRKYRRAQKLVEQWREKLPPMERSRQGAERRMGDELLEGYLQTAGRLYRTEPNAALAVEMFTLIQHTRAWSMEPGGTGGSPVAGPLSSTARQLESRWLAGEESAGAALKAVRASILEQEAAAAPGAGKTQLDGKLERPAEGEAVLTYWLHSEGSWLWVWTNRGLIVTPLAKRETILEAAEAFRKAVEANTAAVSQLGFELRALLLGRLGQQCLRAKRWDIVADEGLFHVPFGALPGKDGRYLAEDVELRLVPNALKQRSRERAARRFFAVVDPIFNRADERLERPWPWQGVAHAQTGLPRLPGTRREAEAAKRLWSKAGYETSVYSGAESGEEAVLARLAEWQPGVIHIATHTVEAHGRPRLAMSLRADGSQGLLTAEDIGALRIRAELVVMSACHSTGSETGRGSGTLGLTRAWLTAGSEQVISTLWPVGDESSAFFSTFYDRLASDKGSVLAAASALRQAQVACIRAGGVTAQPRNWAAHVLLARR
jgi:CHAT domain-containing protein